MGINSATVKFKKDLLSLINNSGLPICNIEMILASTYCAVQEKLKEAIELESKKEEEVKTDD